MTVHLFRVFYLMKITLPQAIKLLEECSAVIIDDNNTVLYPGLADLTGDADHLFLYFNWTDDEGQDFRLTFAEGANREPTLVGSSLFLTDADGEAAQITLLSPMHTEEQKEILA